MESVAISYSVTGLEDVVASKRIVEEIIGDRSQARFAYAALAVPNDGAYTVHYVSDGESQLQQKR